MVWVFGCENWLLVGFREVKWVWWCMWEDKTDETLDFKIERRSFRKDMNTFKYLETNVDKNWGASGRCDKDGERLEIMSYRFLRPRETTYSTKTS